MSKPLSVLYVLLKFCTHLGCFGFLFVGEDGEDLGLYSLLFDDHPGHEIALFGGDRLDLRRSSVESKPNRIALTK